MTDESYIERALAKLHSAHTNLYGLESYAVTEEHKLSMINIMRYQIETAIRLLEKKEEQEIE